MLDTRNLKFHNDTPRNEFQNFLNYLVLQHFKVHPKYTLFIFYFLDFNNYVAANFLIIKYIQNPIDKFRNKNIPTEVYIF